MRRFLLSLFLCVLVGPLYAANLINDTEIEAYLTKLVEPIVTVAGVPADRFKVYIVNDDDFNAFVRGGEEIYIYTGLLTQIKSPVALQAVIAHELGHTIGGHMAQMSARMDAEMKRTMLIQALGIGLMVAGGNPTAGLGVMAGASGIAQQSMLAFSRDEERMADDLGLDLMVQAGADPNGFILVFEQMNQMTEAVESKLNPNKVNHPLTTERLQNVRDKIAKKNLTYHGDENHDAKMVEEYDLIRAKLIGYLDSAGRVKTLYPNSDKTNPALYARAIANMQGGNLKSARVGVQSLISRVPDNPYFYELLGDIEYQYGHYDNSITAYETALNLVPEAPQIQTALALVLTERNKSQDINRAITLLKTSILKNPTPLAYWVLARAYGADDGRADWAMAEFYEMQHNSKNAKKYAQSAQKKLKKDSPEYIKSGDILKK